MAVKKYQVFVSSTFRDLVDERQDAIRNILDLGHIPAGMELSPASDVEQLQYIKKVIDECDYYVLITGGRYGSLDESGVSFTEREYDYAVKTGKTVLAFVHGDRDSIPVGKSDTAPRLLEALDHFRRKIASGRLVKFWTSREVLQAEVVKSLVRAMADYPAIGWIRGDQAASSEQISETNSALSENAELRRRLAKLETAAKPLISNLAGFDDSVDLSFSFTYYGNGRGSQRVDKVTITWGEVFAAVGPAFKGPATTDHLKYALGTYLKETHDKPSTSILLKADVEKVEAHLIALGLLGSYTASTLKGGIAPFLQLTDVGHARLLEILATRKS